MKRIILIASIASVSILISCGDGNTQTGNEEPKEVIEESVEEEEEHNLFVSEDGNFSINFLEGTPAISSSKVPSDLGIIEMNTFMYEKSVTEVLMVAYSDYPSTKVNEDDDADRLLEGGKNGALTNLNILSPDSEKAIELDGHPGIFFTGNNGQYFVTYEMYLVNNRLYQIAILRDGSYASKEDRDTFLGSFKLSSSEKDGSEE
ncbi:MAG: hypothetical protein HRT57_10795 [Crocinitomicaceae bacterium]|nr:hypothetical protein [Crocinitomicaceae bacterium]